MNLYGSQPDGDKENCDRMNQFSELGSMWKGRVLLSAVIYEYEKPKLEILNLDPNIVSKYCAKTLNKEYIMIAEVLFGEGYPEKKEKYSIEMRWANQEINFLPTSPTRGLWEWYDRKSLTCSFPYFNIESVEFDFL